MRKNGTYCLRYQCFLCFLHLVCGRLCIRTSGRNNGRRGRRERRERRSFIQPKLTNLSGGSAWIEVSGRLNGDKIDAKVSNIKYKSSRNSTIKVLGDNLAFHEYRENKGLHYKSVKKEKALRLYGTLEGISGEWDSDYQGALEILIFY